MSDDCCEPEGKFCCVWQSFRPLIYRSCMGFCLFVACVKSICVSAFTYQHKLFILIVLKLNF